MPSLHTSKTFRQSPLLFITVTTRFDARSGLAFVKDFFLSFHSTLDDRRSVLPYALFHDSPLHAQSCTVTVPQHLFSGREFSGEPSSDPLHSSPGLSA
jgi:hypothetical protein